MVKDNINSASLPTTGGTPGLKDFRPGENAPVLQKLLDAGAILLGKTNLHELAFGITSSNAAYGAVGNAYEPGAEYSTRALRRGSFASRVCAFFFS